MKNKSFENIFSLIKFNPNIKGKNVKDSIPNEKVVVHNFSSLFLAPVVMGIKTSLHLGRCVSSLAGFSLSCIAALVTLGLSPNVNKFAKKTFLSTFEELGEGILSVANLAFIQSVYTAGTIAHPKLPALLVRK